MLGHMFWRLPSPGWPCDDFSWPRSRVVTAQDLPPNLLRIGRVLSPTVSPPTALTSGSLATTSSQRECVAPRSSSSIHCLGHEAHSTRVSWTGWLTASIPPSQGQSHDSAFPRESWIQSNKCSGSWQMLALCLVSPCVCLVFLDGPEDPQKPGWGVNTGDGESPARGQAGPPATCSDGAAA